MKLSEISDSKAEIHIPHKYKKGSPQTFLVEIEAEEEVDNDDDDKEGVGDP